MRKHPLLVLACSIVMIFITGAIARSHPATGATLLSRNVRSRTAARSAQPTSRRGLSQVFTNSPVALVGAHGTLVMGAPVLVPLLSGHRSGHRAPAASAAVGPSGGVWLALRACESGNNYRADTGNGYYGAYQFAPSTWRAIGEPGLPDEAPPAIQDAAARVLMQRAGSQAWPNCGYTLAVG